jgi:flavin reductase (DIM6/NTAB) family NADH-FMN oxidoreductase RutF
MNIDPSKLTRSENYQLLIGSVLPRPIAFVTSINNEGVVNAAPFSFYNVITANPPLISISIGRKPNGVLKDTARNIIEGKEFVVHVVDNANVQLVNETSADFPPDVSEVAEVGFTLENSEKVNVASIKEAKIKLECKLSQALTLGGTEDEPSCDFIIGEVVNYRVEDDLYLEGKIDTGKLEPVSRLGGTDYGRLGAMFSLPRPTFPK